MLRDLTDEDVEMLLGVRIRRISLFDIQKHREEMAGVKGGARKRAQAPQERHQIHHRASRELLETVWPMYPRLTRSSRYDEVDAREVAFKAFKVAYDRESGYLGYKVAGDEFKLDCTKFDKLLLLYKDGHYQVVELPEKLFVGADLIYCGLPERERVFTLAYTNREASLPQALHLWRDHPQEDLSLHPAQIADPVLRAGHAGGAVHQIQAGSVSESQPANLQSRRGRSQRTQDPRPPDLDQGRRLDQQQTAAELGCGWAHHLIIRIMHRLNGGRARGSSPLQGGCALSGALTEGGMNR
jgi:hypothetical protein